MTKILTYPRLELGALIRRSFILDLESLKSYGCIVRYTEHKGFLFTDLTNVEIIGPDSVIDLFREHIEEVYG